MNFNSLITKITLVFLVVFFILFTLFIFFIDYEKKVNNSVASNYHEKISAYLKGKRMPRHLVKKYLESNSFELAQNPFEIIPNAKVISSTRKYETLIYDDKIYFHVTTPHFKILFLDNTKYEKTYYTYLIFSIFFVILIFIYFWLINTLKPLEKLKDDIDEFSKGNLPKKYKNNKKDEISNVANSFYETAKKIDLLLKSRQLFLRTIMHELKTPIAKGRIVCELIQEQKQKNRMVDIFERLDFLINDFSNMEQVISKNYKLEKKKCTFDEVLKQSFKLLMLDKNSKSIKLDLELNTSFFVDLSLMSMVFKNLIDNALKYSNNKEILISQENNSLLFVSLGDKLSKPLEEYFKPFHNETSKKTHGMGLGLYIVYTILQMHNMKFEYKYENNLNTFKITY